MATISMAKKKKLKYPHPNTTTNGHPWSLHLHGHHTTQPSMTNHDLNSLAKVHMKLVLPQMQYYSRGLWCNTLWPRPMTIDSTPTPCPTMPHCLAPNLALLHWPHPRRRAAASGWVHPVRIPSSARTKTHQPLHSLSLFELLFGFNKCNWLELVIFGNLNWICWIL